GVRALGRGAPVAAAAEAARRSAAHGLSMHGGGMHGGSMIDARALVHRVEALIDPVGEEDAGMLEALDRFAAEVLPEGRVAELEASGEFPAEELAALARGPLGAELTPVDQGGSLDWSRAMRLTARLAAHDVGLTLCLGGTVLGA